MAIDVPLGRWAWRTDASRIENHDGPGMMVRGRAILAALTLALWLDVPAFADAPEPRREPFSPAGCDFEVRFPCAYHVRPPADGGLPVAVMQGALSTVEAVCATNYPEGFLERLSDAQIARFITSLAQRAGTAPVRVVKLAEDSAVRMFAVRAAEAAGDDAGAASLWVYGPHSRLIVESRPWSNPEAAAPNGSACPRRPGLRQIMTWIGRVD